MNILYLCTYYHRAMIFRDEMNALEQIGNKVIAFNAADKGEGVDEKYAPIMDDKVVHKELFNKWDKLNYFAKQKKYSNAVEKNISLTEIELMHSHTLFNGGWAARCINKKYGIPYVVTVRNTDMNDYIPIPGFKWIARKIVETANGVLFLSGSYRDEFISKCYSRCSREIRESVLKKCMVIPNGLEPFWLNNIYEAKCHNTSEIQLLCVGKIDKNKNMKTVKTAMDLLNGEGCKARLTIIGQVVDEEIKNELKQDDCVEIVSYLSKEELISYYRKADVFVMPSFHESFGRVYAEAMSQGLPVIYTRGQGFDGLFEEGEVGYSVKADDAEEIVKSIRSILSNYNEISYNCINNCTKFDWKDIARRLNVFYCVSRK